MLIPIIKESEKLREVFAEIEHEQWIAWSKNIAETENITPARLERWQKLWRPYSELTEAEKDQDREWGDKGFSLNNSSQLALLEGLKETWYPFMQHSSECVLESFEAGESTKDGYRQKFNGKWYQVRPVDETPKCDCGFDTAVTSLEESITYLKSIK